MYSRRSSSNLSTRSLEALTRLLGADDLEFPTVGPASSDAARMVVSQRVRGASIMTGAATDRRYVSIRLEVTVKLYVGGAEPVVQVEFPMAAPSKIDVKASAERKGAIPADDVYEAMVGATEDRFPEAFMDAVVGPESRQGK